VAANTLAPSGFHPAFVFGASPGNYAIWDRQLSYNYASNIAYGDPVLEDTNGLINVVANGGTTIAGIALGVDFFDPNNILSGRYHAAWLQPSLASSIKVSVKVMADPRMVFYCQARGTAVTATAIGKNVDIYTGTSAGPVTGSGLSVCALDIANAATTSTLPFRIVGIVGLTPGFSPVAAINSSYVATNDNQWLAVMMNTQDLTTRSGQH
jgi:hypothetical protein